MKSGNNILITGAAGQLGVELTAKLREKFGGETVLATDIRDNKAVSESGPFEKLDVLDKAHLTEIARRYDIGTVYHLAAILSARGEANIEKTWQLNMDGLLNVLELAREGLSGAAGQDPDHSVASGRVFWPSSIAVFGPDLPREQTPQDSPLNPTTVYGISKVAGEQWCAYYHRRFGVDVRSVRYPGLIGNKSEPGGGTTDYAVEMLRSAARGEAFTSPLKCDTCLPMMYMDDAVKAVMDLMDADASQLRVRTSYNVTAMSFSPGELLDAIREHVNGFDINYKPDEREKIAASWPDSIDDSDARRDWSWRPGFDLEAMVREMLTS